MQDHRTDGGRDPLLEQRRIAFEHTGKAERAERDWLGRAIRCGEALLEARGSLSPAGFESFQERLDLSREQADLYMRVAKDHREGRALPTAEYMLAMARLSAKP